MIPEAIRDQARLRPGDKLEVGYVNGLVILRKRVALTPASARALILAGRDLPVATEKAEAAVQDAIETVRRRRSR